MNHGSLFRTICIERGGVAGRDVVVVQNTPGRKEVGVFLVGHFRRRGMFDGLEEALAPGERLGVQNRSARMIRRRAGPLQAGMLDTVVVDAGEYGGQ